MKKVTFFILICFSFCFSCYSLPVPDLEVEKALEASGNNRAELELALNNASDETKNGIKFLIAYMKKKDLKTITSGFLLTHVEKIYEQFKKTPWKEQVPEEIFLNNILPYTNVTEKKELWVKQLNLPFIDIVKDINQISLAAARLNQFVFKRLGVKYSPRRYKADQAPSETISTGLASCTGLSILLIDIYRALGIPARLVGTPLWADGSGNHTWVEIWDKGWHFTGAAEATGDELDKAWFIQRATQAQREHPLKAIYAVSYRPRPIYFPMVWAAGEKNISAVNVTDRYTSLDEEIPNGHLRLMFKVVNSNNQRVAVLFKIREKLTNSLIFQKISNDDRFDLNDHISGILVKGREYIIQVNDTSLTFIAQKNLQLVTLKLIE